MISRTTREIVCFIAPILVPVMIFTIVPRAVTADSESNPEIEARYSVTLEEVRRFQNVLWVDARSRRAYESEHIPQAILLNAAEWEDLASPFLDAWNPDIPIVVYCDSESCNASSQIAERLRNEMGIGNVFVLKGGWETWKKAHR